MNVLVFNCGSSSQSARLYQAEEGKAPLILADFKATSITAGARALPEIKWYISDKKGNFQRESISHNEAAGKILELLAQHGLKVDAVGHRFVHGGDVFDRTTLITPQTLQKLKECFPLAPIHNPNSYGVIEVCLAALPGVKQFAVFDTAFHAGLPESAKRYALPQELAQQYGYRKFGFHGLSLQYVSAKTTELLGKPLDQVKLILCHLGSGGSSVTAFAEGRSLDTSMGYSPLAGLVMSTRPGDLDPGILVDLARRGYNAEEIEHLLNKQSGLIGLSGYSSNLEEVIERAESGDEACRIAFEVYANRVKHYLGAYHWLLNGAEVMVFTDGIGVSSWRLREAVLANAENLGVMLDREANRKVDSNAATWIHDAGSKVKILVLPTDEERVIFEEVIKLL